MQCLSPISKLDKKNGRLSIPCGKCLYCNAKRRGDWSFRLWQEYKRSKTAFFVTFTYSNENLVDYVNVKTGEIRPSLHKPDVQLFIKRLRKYQEEYIKKELKLKTIKQARAAAPQIRYYACGEYGEITKRPHYHMILFNLDLNLKDKILDIWKLGHVHIGTCNAKTIAYTTKYINKETSNQESWVTPQFSIMSKRPPIGHEYLKENLMFHKKSNINYVKDDKGRTQRLPKFYKDKIFNQPFKKIAQRQESIKNSDESYKRETKRINQLGMDEEKYRHDQLKDQIRKNTKINNKDKL
ncbi:replication initiator protein [Microviridae sp.]|nr:replication initiator protein [Microviridae sp.]